MPEWHPHALEIEQELLGAVLLNNASFSKVDDVVQPEYFYEPVHQHIWQICADLIRSGKLASPLTIKPFLPIDLDLGGVSLSAYIARLAAAATTVTKVRDYALIVRELFAKRLIGETAKEMLPQPDRESAEVASWVVERMDQVIGAQLAESVRGVSIEASVTRAIDAAAMAYQNEGAITGLSYGWRDLDQRTLGAHRGNLIVVAGRPGMGKFQPVHSPVLTPSGWRRMGDLRVGDMVISQDGLRVPITGVFPQGRRDVYRVTFSDGRSTLAGAEHLWEVHSKHWRAPRVIDTVEVMRLLDLVRYRKWLHVPLYNGRGFADTDLPVPPYTLGAWLGDGSAPAGRITKPDREIFDRIVGEGYSLGAPGPTRTVIGLTRDLRKAGVLDLNSWARFIPQAYFTASFEQRLALLNGLVDTDGTVEPSGTIRYCSSSYVLAQDVQRLARSLGGVCKISKKTTTHRDAYILTIRHPEPYLIVTLPRKAARLPRRYQYGDRLKLRIDKVELVGQDECQCISIDHPRGLYVTDDYAVTHNTALAVSMARNFGMSGRKVMIYSAEMVDTELTQRMIADQMFDEGRFFYSQIRSGKFHANVFDRIKDAGQFLATLPIRIEQQPQLTVAQIAARARQMKARSGLDVLVVDHIGLVRASSRYAGNKVYETGEITGSLKAIAKELDIVVIALAQIVRGVDARDDKRPQLSDLRNSGDIEQDADTVLLLYREAYYLSRKEPPAGSAEYILWEQGMNACANRLDVEVAKQRSGPVGPVKLFCDIGANAIRNWQGDFA